MLNDVEFREVQEVAKVDKVKIVACDGKSGFAASQILSAINIKIRTKIACNMWFVMMREVDKLFLDLFNDTLYHLHSTE
jgi:hypothetical protein